MPRVYLILLLAFVWVLPTYGLPAWADPPGELTLTLLHDNDLHGHLLPFAYTEVGRSAQEQPSVGGAARRATLIRSLRREIKNPTMLIDSGDVWTRGPLSNAYEGLADIEAMNAVGYELAAVGNNEFKAKDAVEQTDAAGAQVALLRVIKRSRFPWVCANAVDQKGAFLEGVQPYVVRVLGGVRIGFLGLTAPRSASYPQTKGWTISDPIAAAAEWIPKARVNCDVLIAVTHIGVDLDKQLAAQTSGIDAIVGGDSHTFLYQPLSVANAVGVQVPIVQDGEFGADLGRFDLRFVRNSLGRWRLAGYRDVLLPVRDNLKEAPDVVDALAPYVQPFQTVVGHLDAVGKTPPERTRLTTQVVVDALRRETGADLAINPDNGGFFEVFRRPAVTKYDVYAVMPFKNHVVTAALTGGEVQALLKAHPETVVSGSEPTLDVAKTYNIALVDFMGTTVYKFPEARLQDTGRDLRDVVIADLSRARK